MRKVFLALVLAVAPALAGAQRAKAPPPRPWMNAHLPVERRAQLLLRAMTLEEKFWQLYMAPGDPRSDSTWRHGAFGVQLLALRDAGGGARAATTADDVQRWFVEKTRLGIPAIVFEEGVHGLMQEGATIFPSAIGLAASFDTGLVARVGATIARQSRDRGVRMLLSPVINLARDPRWGRVEETYGEDSWLSSALGVAYTGALERRGVVATPKHFVANYGDGGRDSYPIALDQATLEDLYFPPFRSAIKQGGAQAVMASYNSVNGLPASANPSLLIGTLRRDWKFGGVVIADQGGVGGASVLHHTAADYAASTALALRAGLDVIFQSGAKDAALFWPPFKDGRIPRAAVDSAVARVLRLKFGLGLFDAPYVGGGPSRQDVSVDADALAGVAAGESLVLLRNQRGTLPLSKETARIALIGEDANVVTYGGYTVPPAKPARWIGGLVGGSGGVAKVEYAVGPRRRLDSFVPVTSAMLRTDTTRSAAPGLTGEYFSGIAMEGVPATTRVDPQVDFSWTFNRPARGLGTDWYSIRWTGFVSLFPRANPRLAVEGDDGIRLWVDGALVIDAWGKTGYGRREVTLHSDTGAVHSLRLEYRQTTGNGRVRLLWDNGLSADLARQADSTQTAQAVAAASRADAAVLVMGVDEGEFRDRSSLRLTDRQEALIERVAATGKPTIVVLHTGGAVVMTPWIDKVGAVLLAPYPGPTAAVAVGEALFGIRSPAGRLPFTVPRSEGQLPLAYDHLPTGRGDDYIDLTGQPLFPFGYGLSYTTFDYSALQLSQTTASARDTVHVRFTISNAGPMASDEVPQLYVRHVTSPTAQPVLSLRGFARVPLQPGERRVIDLPLAVADLAVRDLDGKRRVVPGDIIIYVGASSRDIRLRATLSIK